MSTSMSSIGEAMPSPGLGIGTSFQNVYPSSYLPKNFSLSALTKDNVRFLTVSPSLWTQRLNKAKNLALTHIAAFQYKPSAFHVMTPGNMVAVILSFRYLLSLSHFAKSHFS